MAEPWTTVEWAPWPARPNDPAALCRGRSSAELTACRAGMAQTTAHDHTSTEARGMPGGGARAARGGSPSERHAGHPLWAALTQTSASDTRGEGDREASATHACAVSSQLGEASPPPALPRTPLRTGA